MRVAENGVHQNLLLSMQRREQDAADTTRIEIDTESVREKAMKDSRLSIFFRQAPPGSDHGQVGGAVQEEIFRFLEMENALGIFQAARLPFSSKKAVFWHNQELAVFEA